MSVFLQQYATKPSRRRRLCQYQGNEATRGRCDQVSVRLCSVTAGFKRLMLNFRLLPAGQDQNSQPVQVSCRIMAHYTSKKSDPVKYRTNSYQLGTDALGFSLRPVASNPVSFFLARFSNVSFVDGMLR